jgi:hypothetical protein
MSIAVVYFIIMKSSLGKVRTIDVDPNDVA